MRDIVQDCSSFEEQSGRFKYLRLSREHEKPEFLALSPKRSELGKCQIGRKRRRTDQSGIWDKHLGRFQASQQLRFAGNRALFYIALLFSDLQWSRNFLSATRYVTRPSCECRGMRATERCATFLAEWIYSRII